MGIICEIDLDQAKNYANSVVMTRVNNKKQKVYFKLRCDETNLIEAINFVKNNKYFICTVYNGLEDSEVYQNITKDTGVLIIRVTEYGNNIKGEDIESLLESTPDGITPIVKLPEEFNDLHLIWEFSKKYDRVRFCGGDLFCINGCRLGCCGEELFNKLGVNEKNRQLDKIGCSCYYDVYDFEELELEITKVEKEKKAKTNNTKKKATKKAKKPKISFLDLMSGKSLNFND